MPIIAGSLNEIDNIVFTLTLTNWTCEFIVLESLFLPVKVYNILADALWQNRQYEAQIIGSI